MRLLPTLLMSLLSCLPLASAVADSTSLTDRGAVHRQAEAFMEKVTANDIGPAYQQLRPYLGVASDPYDQSAEDAKGYFQRVTAQVGQPLAYSHIKTEVIGEDFYRETWLQKFGAAAIAWTFTFYQPESGWKLVGVGYSTDIEPLYTPAD